MRTTTALATQTFVIAAFLHTGCGTQTETFTCDPQCPSGYSCGPTGCVSNSVLPDLSSQVVPDLTMQCLPACSGTTAYCSASFQCVACLIDSHCPAGQICTPSGSTTICVAGCRDDSGCNNAGANPERKCCSGACIDTSRDLANCGGCDTPCTIAHASATCASSSCQRAACDSGWGDCNGDDSDGCEANLTIDPAQCGACGTPCAIANAVAGCSSSCYIAACRFGWDDCDGETGNGCEQSVVADIKNCGACGNSCAAAPHAMVGCLNATCLLTSCAKGFLDCNGSTIDGCEVTGATDPVNCGACGNACAKGMVCRGSQCTCPQCNIPNASSKCFNNQCVLDKCNPGFGDGDGDVKNGCEVDVTKDPSNCSVCKKVCPQNTPYCLQSVCSDTNHNIYVLMPDFSSDNFNGCGDFSIWHTQDMGQMTYDDCETTANQYGAQFMGQDGQGAYFGNYNAPYKNNTRWVGEVDAKNAWVGTQNWNQLSEVSKDKMNDCVLAYANNTMPGQTSFDTTWVSDNGKTYQVKDYGVISEKTCYSNALDAGARPLNPWMFADATQTTAHMVENHICHGSCEYSGKANYSNDGNANHNYRCLVGYTND